MRPVSQRHCRAAAVPALLLPLFALLLLTKTAAPAANLEITVQPVFNGEPLRLDSLSYSNSAGETLSVTRLSYLLSGFALEGDDGQWVELPGSVAWMDAVSRRNVFPLRNVPSGIFRALRFHVGPEATANAADVSKLRPDDPLNPHLNGLHWSWQSGYIFLAMEGHWRTGNSEARGYSLHLARDPNRTRIGLSARLDLTRDAGILLHFDLAALLNAPRPLSFEKDGSATHSRPGDPVSAALTANLPGAFRVSRIASQQPQGDVKSPAAPAEPIDLPAKFTLHRFTMSRTFPIPDLPRDNPLIVERVTLGERLFHEKALSRDGTISCASCHQADAAFTDRLPLSTGIEGRRGNRNAMPLFNLAWKKEFFWDGRARSLRDQVLMPIQDHREMDESPARVCEKLAASADYPALFRSGFSTPAITPEKMALALEQYLLTLTARNAKFDRVLAGRESFTDPEKRGLELFMTEYEPRTGQFGADCFHCHGGPLFTDHGFHNNGAGGLDPGRGKVTGLTGDEGKFATPSLRNIAITGPYMHDGRFSTLEEVIDHYSSGIHRSPTLDPNLAKHPAAGLRLSDADKAALAAFLRTLTDEGHNIPAGLKPIAADPAGKAGS